MVRKNGFWCILKNILISSQLTTHEFFSLDLKKKHFWRILNNPDFKVTWIFHRWIIFTLSHQRVLKRMWILFSWTILLNNSLKRFSCRATEMLHHEQLPQKFPQGIRPSPRLWLLPDLLTYVWKYVFLSKSVAFQDIRIFFTKTLGWMFEFSFVK